MTRDFVVERLAASRFDEAAAVLGRAFRRTPLMRAVFRELDDDGRAEKLRRMFRSFVVTCAWRGLPEVVLDADRVAAVALTFPPGGYPLGPLAWLRNGLGAAALGPRYTWRLARVDSYMQKHHIEGAHHYLYVLGVDTALQGRGLGGALLRRLSSRADADALPAYLETDDPNNVPLYQRFGYRVLTAEQPAALPSVTMWRMQREPSAAAP
jgi:ribosomal protein S18 acetylase RimI-like enzyme